MKEILKKIASVCKLIFGYGIMIVLAIGALLFFGYVAALIVGGDTAVAICAFLSQKVTPVMVYASTVLVLFGLFSMYLAGEKALTSGKKKVVKHEGEK
ncbi:MAG: hypothetical protein J6W28_03500 [Clostridia bacterium]|nr:hypothetical protein [Clostridia bacterium]